ncbi:hypothetical protein COO60DRAFT_1549354 [Scenedesmus sp. NREL 46B-D3]|nr:hypothetical protein COO60DRAFT_1549354 [Scenedesmus sp. NREL 46B-D3]
MRAYTLFAAVICCLTVASLCRSSSAVTLRLPKISDDAASCHNSTSIAECHTKANCTWCQSTLFPSGCWASSEAKFLPGFAYHCEEAPSAAEPAHGCMLKATEVECSASEQCAWCNGLLGASCFSKDQAQMLPPGFYTCKETGEKILAAALAAAPAHGSEPGSSCSGPTDRKACRKNKGCVWCEGSFGPSSCYSEDQAKYLPAQFFKCSKPKHANNNDSGIGAAVAAA